MLWSRLTRRSLGVVHALYRTTSRADYESCTMNDDNGEMLVSCHPNRRYTDTPAVGASYYFDPWQRNCADGRMKITVATFAAGQNDPVPFPIFALLHVAICNTIPDPFAHAGAGAAYRYALAQAAALYCTWEVSGGGWRVKRQGWYGLPALLTRVRALIAGSS